MSKQDKAIVIALAAVLVGVWLKSDPRCDLGCQTVAQHLISHGFKGLGLS